MKQQAWSFKAIKQGDLRYFGNDGYDDDESSIYRYDNLVANHKNVKAGDIVVVTNRNEVLGFSVVENITFKHSSKKINKCAHDNCDAKKISQRKKKRPEWRCSNNHEFENPRIIHQPIVEYVAFYKNNYTPLKNISMENLISKTLRYNVQLSIQEINIDWARELLDKVSTSSKLLDAKEADIDDFTLQDDDLRQTIERHIKQRRGQKKFRDQLLLSNPVCAVTGCGLTDILEAAHIDAYRNASHNHISNGLLLRSDIHTLFDLNLLAINPVTEEIFFSNDALNEGYKPFQRKKTNKNHKLSYSALAKRWETFNKSE